MFVVMPDHVHLVFGIAALDDAVPHAWRATDALRGRGMAHHAPTPTDGRSPTDGQSPSGGTPRRFVNAGAGTVATIAGAYKSAVSRVIHADHLHDGAIWQRGYHDRVIRTDHEAENVRRYVRGNPARWLRP